MQNQKGPNHTEDQETSNGPDGSVTNGRSIQKRPRIPYAPNSVVLSSDRLTNETTDILDPDAAITEEEIQLLGDPDLDLDDGVDELLGEAQYLDDTDFDGDLLNEESGRRAGSGGDLDVPDEELDNAGTAMQQEDEENDFFGLQDEEGPEDDPGKNIF